MTSSRFIFHSERDRRGEEKRGERQRKEKEREREKNLIAYISNLKRYSIIKKNEVKSCHYEGILSEYILQFNEDLFLILVVYYSVI